MVTVWAESPEEARNFILNVYGRADLPPISEIRVAKRSPTSRGNNYLGGQYYVATNDDYVDVTDEVVEAPIRVKELVQWCTCDIMLSIDDEPVCVIEDTTHIVRMNVFQRAPRIIKAAQLGVHAIILQGTYGLELSKRSDNWALYRYMLPFQKANKIHGNTLVCPVLYLPDEHSQDQAEQRVSEILYSIFNAPKRVKEIKIETEKELDDIIHNGFNGYIAPPLPSIEVLDNEVIVKIGAKPDKPSWKTKGSGQMDPYIGMIAAAKYAYCYNEFGDRTRDLIVEFTFIPEGFFYFDGWEKSTSLYKRLAFEIADEVRFLG